MKGVLSFIIFFVFFPLLILAQQQDIETLKATLARLEKQENFAKDTNYLQAMNELAFKFWSINPDSTRILAEKSKSLCQQANYGIGLVEAIRNIGISCDAKGNYTEALQHYAEALPLAEKINYKKGIGRLYNNIAIIYRSQGNYTEAIENYLKSLKIKEEIGDKQGTAASLNNIALVYEKQEKNEEALMNYSKSLKIKEEIGDKQGIATSLNNIALVYYKQERYDKALEYQTKSLQIKQEIGDKVGTAGSLNNIGLIYEKQKKYNEALKKHTEALLIAEEVGNKQEIIASKNGVANVYFELKNYSKALPYAKEGLKLSEEIGSKEKIKDIHELLNKIYKATKNYELALWHYEQYKQYSDSLSNKEIERKTSALQAQYEYDKKVAILKVEQAKKDLEQEKELQEHRIQRDGFIAGFILLLVIAFLITLNLQKQRKAKMILQNKNDEIVQKNTQIAQQAEKLQEAFKTLDEKNRGIIASINAAKRIQDAMLPSRETISAALPKHFILFMPSNIVSGDFYWLVEKGNRIVLAVSDCTGHGIPGALMSMIGINILDDIVNSKNIISPDEILHHLNKDIYYILHHDKTEANEGMDIAVITLEKDAESTKLAYAGAMNPLYYVQQNELFEIKATKKTIGGRVFGNTEKQYEKHEITIHTPTTFYLCTDGYQDQFGGENNRKFMVKKLKELLLQTSQKEISQQGIFLQTVIEDWMLVGNEKQIDDITVLGFVVE